MIIRARAPLRLGLAGGGTDISPYCDNYGGYILNATIDRYAYAVIKTLGKPIVRFVATDQQTFDKISIHDQIPLDGKLNLHKAVYNHMIQHFNCGEPIPMELSTFCDAPAGSGLGSSSTLVVAMVRAFVELLNLPLGDHDIAQLAYRIERLECGLQGGRQDQYSATFGGFNFMEFYAKERTIVNPLRVKNWILCELEASLILYFTGVSRESARIIAVQSNSVKEGSISALEAMHGMKQEATVMKECLLRGDFKGFVDSMNLGWKNKKRSAKTVSNPYIDEIYESAVEAGALAGKVSGAGGGGFMLFFVPPEKRLDVIRRLNSFPGQVSNCHFTKNGCQAWRIG
uniref:D-glycero-alpha-D-manno-heptose-7-phosphate kinase n=1 Tax=Candidatus Kentrum sp. SD TaxID=2126332 RepID=A0A451BMQ3_9GAMM|nr:MAG: D-glycero-alpha-D-manno-heptose-7-phosphate kinase [Candidatus Kentron sp. SD]